MTDVKPPFEVISLYEYKSEYDDDLSFPAGVRITVTDIEDEDWYTGAYNGKKGLFPKNFVEISGKKEDRRSTTASGMSLGKVPDLSEPEKEKPVAESSPIIEPEEKIESIGRDEAEKGVGHKESKGSDALTALESSKVPMPGQRVADPYTVKKQFLASSKSSYVPEIKPRAKNVIGHAHNDTHDNIEVVKGTDAGTEEEAGPKMSLKDRIAMLQQRQEEERQREEALLKKQEKKKQKALEERQSHGPSKSIGRSSTEVADETILNLEESGEEVEDYEDAESRDNETTSQNIPISPIEQENEDASGLEKDEGEGENQDQGDGVEGNLEEEAESEDEELKRKRLVERMARISGGRNMFGMMGMASPFQQPASSKPNQKKAAQPEVPSGKDNDTQSKKAIPVMPFANPNSLPKAPAPAEKAVSGLTSFNDSNFDNTTTSNVKSAKYPDSNSLIEEDTTEEYGRAEPKSLNTAIAAHPELSSLDTEPEDLTTDIQSNVDARDNDNEIENFNLKETSDVDVKLEPENTGYEADEDLSDPRKEKNQLNNDSLSIPPIPSVRPSSNVPPIPSLVPSIPSRTSSHSKAPSIPSMPPPPPIPSVSESQNKEQYQTSSRNVETLKVDDIGRPPIPTQAPIPPTPSSNDAHAKESALGSPPPLPTETSPPVPRTAESVYESSSSLSDDDGEADLDTRTGFVPVDVKRPITMPETAAPPIPGAPPVLPVRRTSTTVHRTSVGSRKSGDFTGVERRRSLKSKHQERSQADHTLSELEFEFNNINGDSNWWLKGELPETLSERIGEDLVYEVDTNKINKRGGRSIVYKDYYILFFDLSQIVIELEYEIDDPRSTIKVTNFFVKPPPIIRKDLLEKYFHEFNTQILEITNSLVGSRISDSLTSEVFSILQKRNPKLLSCIGNKSFGVNIYKNNNNSSIAKIDDVKPGDILCVKQGKFVSHKGLTGNKTLNLGSESSIYSAIITEYDLKKEKFKVLGSDGSGSIKKASFKLGEMKSGKIRVFRAVNREYIGW